MTKLLLSAAITLLSSLGCGRGTTPDAPDPEGFQDQPATVRVHVATRGSYQYLLAVEKEGAYGEARMYLPAGEMDEQFHTDGMAVRFDGRLTGDSVWVMRPGPTDIPEQDFRAPVIQVERMWKDGK